MIRDRTGIMGTHHITPVVSTLKAMYAEMYAHYRKCGKIELSEAYYPASGSELVGLGFFEEIVEPYHL